MYKYIYKYREKIELYDKLVRIHLILNNIQLTEQQINVLIYFTMYGINKEAFEVLIKDKMVPSFQIINNTKTKLRKLGLIEMKSYKNWNVNHKLAIPIDKTLNIMTLCKYE
jgi:hypothetical protein